MSNPSDSAGARPRLRHLAFAIALALPCVSSAAEPDERGTVKLDEVLTTAEGDAYTVTSTSAATKLDLSPRQTPQSISVITRERIEDQDLTSLREVLDNTPGIYSDAYDTERVLFYSRGFLVDTLLFDGVPALPNFNTGSIDETIDPAMYERIEIVRGATGLLSGAGSPAASVNLVRKHADSRTPALSVDLSAGSWDRYRTEIDGSVPLNADASIRARGVAVYEERDSFQALYHKNTSVLYGIIDADLGDATRVSLGIEHQNNKPRGNTWGSFPLFLADGTWADWPRSVTTATDWSFWNRRTDTVFAELRHDLGNDWSLRGTANWRRYEEDVALFYVFGYPDPVTGEGLEPYAYRNDGKIIDRSIDLYASGPFSLFDRSHELVVGYSASRSTNTGTEYAVGDLAGTGNFFEWDGTYPRPVFGAGALLSDIDTDQDGLYAAARFSLADPLKWIAGARRARWKVDSYYLYDAAVNSRYDFNETIPYTGLVYDVSREFSLFASYTGVFKPQNNRDVTGRYLDPMDGRSAEIGIKGEHYDGRLNTSLTLFETRQDNVAAPVFDPETGEPVLLPDGRQASQAIDGTRTRGFEAEISGRFAENWQGSLGWSRYVMHDGNDQPVRTFIPGTLVRGFVTWTPKQWVDGLTLGGGIDWQGRSSTFVSSPDGGTILGQGGFARVQLMARYRLSPVWSVQFNADNALDKKYLVLDQFDNTYYGTPANYALSLRGEF
ncbi:MAG TPA: TonB-dependent siderophore receptor [Tahibacter sp.]|nr:TonB-dependent siderophore receptor [Tahibacter sp.]